MGKNRPAPVPGVPGMPNGFGGPERLLPEKCLLRFIDVQIEQGKTYEYQVQVKMGNPLYGKNDQAISKKLTEGKEITGEWTVVNKRLHVPFEGDFYFYEDPQKSHNFAASPDRVWTQIHRWFDWVPVNPAGPRESLTAIGDWGVAEQSAATRGECIGRWEEVELPVWNPKQEEFVLAQHPDTYKGGRRAPGSVSSTTRASRLISTPAHSSWISTAAGPTSSTATRIARSRRSATSPPSPPSC